MKQAPLQDATLEALAAHVFAEIRALSPDSAGVSRPAFSGIETKVLDWLAASSHHAAIAAVRSAHRKHGGDGALYIVLKRER